MKLLIIEHKDIDKQWWNAEIEQCTNSLIYAQAWYLDAVSPNWKAAVIGDSQAFVPITHSKRFGILPIWTQPLLAQQLGCFYKPGFEITPAIFKKIKKAYLKTHVHLNARSLLPNAENRINYVLELRSSYAELKGAYTKDARKNLKKAIEFEINEPPFDESKFQLLTQTYAAQYGSKEKLTSTKLNLIKRLLFAAKENNALSYYEMKSKKEKILLSAAILKDKKRIYYLFAAPTDLGRKQSITHFFIDHLIQTHASSELTLDFEGSMIPSVAQFYKKWGVKEELYGVYT